MSRCFPFPPPGYVRNGIRDEALIESIKREEEKARKERKKERKREKKEKKKRAGENGEAERKKHSYKRRHKDEGIKEDQKVADHQKRKENEVELLEKSSLTEEHGHLIGSQNSCDSTLNSNKRQKQSLSSDGRHNNSESIWIRLPVKRQNDPQVLTSKEQQPCSSQGLIDDASGHPCSTSTDIAPECTISLSEQNRASLYGSSKQLSLRLTKEKPSPSPPYSSSEQPTLRLSEDNKPCPSSDSSKPCTQKPQTVQPSNTCGICPPSVALQFQNLVESWVPSPIRRQVTDFDDQEWLLRQNNLEYGSKRREVSSVVGNSSTQPWPRACFLPEADVYALPFTIPF